MQSLKSKHQKVGSRREELGTLLPGKAQEGSWFSLEGSRWVKGRGQGWARGQPGVSLGAQGVGGASILYSSSPTTAWHSD